MADSESYPELVVTLGESKKSRICCVIVMLILSIVVLALAAFLVFALVTAIKGDSAEPETSLQTASYSHARDITALIHELTEKYHRFTYRHSIGESEEGSDMEVLVISTTPYGHSLKQAEVQLIGGVYGDEPAGVEILATFAQYLLTGLNSSDPDLRHLFTRTRLHILFAANPDGLKQFFAAADRYGSVGEFTQQQKIRPGRNNSRGIDIEWDFGEFPKSKEAKNIREWSQNANNPFVLSLSLHGGNRVILHPSGEETANPVADKDLFEEIGRNFSRVSSGRNPCSKADLNIPGSQASSAALATWKTGRGVSLMDFLYNHTSAFPVSALVSCRRAPDERDLSAIWERTRDPLIDFVRMATFGAYGLVTAGGSGQPVRCYLKVVDQAEEDHVLEHVTRCTDKGEFWRPLTQGSYQLIFTAEGYERKTEFFSLNADQIPEPLEVKMMEN